MLFDVSEPHTCTKIDDRARQAWEQDGVLKISGLIPFEWSINLRQRVIEILGTEPENPLVWPNLQPSLLKPIGRNRDCAPLEIEVVKEAVDNLIGKGGITRKPAACGLPMRHGNWKDNMRRRLI